MNDTYAAEGQHGDGQFCRHGHMQCYTVACFESAEILQHCCEFIHPYPKFLIGDMIHSFLFQFRHKVDGCFVAVFCQMSVYTVVGGIDQTALEPFVAGSIAGIQNRIPVFVPVQQIRVFLVAVRHIFQGHALIYAFVRHICLGNEFSGRGIHLLLFPVGRDCSFRYIQVFVFFFCHFLFSPVCFVCYVKKKQFLSCNVFRDATLCHTRNLIPDDCPRAKHCLMQCCPALPLQNSVFW